ncbi:hypothetical protein BDP27DRAFT_1414754 [Rhodocollybia butyracea]|uniref:BRCT domain-containing protein n=1 Tax=Rhodocollybia butyracea TaxID=206335 RepID=A0A9P5Q159_9AGAR|nr:hypothetical protein BDP27DRAFT_1414754 [Rhodocollybia butyracea]
MNAFAAPGLSKVGDSRKSNIEDPELEAADESQFLPPRLMRRDYRSPNEPHSPSDQSSFQSNAFNVPTSHTSSQTPDSSRGNTAEPSYAQQNVHHPSQQMPMAPSFGQPGPVLPSPFPFDQQLLPQIISNPIQSQNFLMALADVYRNNMQNNMQMNFSASTNVTQAQPLHSGSSLGHSSAVKVEESSGDVWHSSEPPNSSSSSQKGKRRAASPDSANALSSRKGKRKAISPSPDHSLSNPPDEILTRNGKSLVFFVQVDLSQRHDLVNKIKKHGGIITPDHNVADFSILSPKSKTFSALFKAVKGPAISTTFIHDCVEKGRLLHIGLTSKYLVEAPRKLTRQSSDSFVQKKKTKLEARSIEEHTQTKKPKFETARVVKVEPAVVKKRVASAHKPASAELKAQKYIPSYPPSPPPPPESSRILWNSGKYQYTASEREYVGTLVKCLFERDHQMSMTEIAKHLHRKMPHHPLRSWETTLTGQLREVVDLARKRAGIAFRKKQYNEERCGRQQPVASSSSEVAHKSAKRPKLDAEDSMGRDFGQVNVEDPEERDLRFVTQFFTGGGAEGIDEDDDENRSELWVRLHEQAKWRTSSSWEEFYEEHHEEIKRRFGEIMGQETEE